MRKKMSKSEKRELLQGIAAQVDELANTEMKNARIAILKRIKSVYDLKLFEAGKDSEGKSLKSFAEWLTANPPDGAAIGRGGTRSIGPSELANIAIENDMPTEFVEAIKNAKPKRANQHTSPKVEADNISQQKSVGKTGGTSREYLLQRLAEFDSENGTDWWNQVMTNKLSARKAAIEAGLIKDTNNPLMRLKANWRKATPEQREEFRKWLRTKEAK